MLAAMINQPGYFSPNPHAGQPYTALGAYSAPFQLVTTAMSPTGWASFSSHSELETEE